MGHHPDEHSDFAWEAMIYGMARRETLSHLKFSTQVAAILTAGRMAAGADPGDAYKKTYSHYYDMLFPEQAEDTEEKTRKIATLLKSEYEKGPMTVQSLNYETKRKKKR